MSIHKIFLKVNGKPYGMEVKSNRTLLQVIREDLKLKGTKKGCERGDCGLCTILIDGVPTKSCLVLAVEVDGREILTIEGLSQNGRLTPLQKSFIEHGALQCGYCTPAFILAGEALLVRSPKPSREEVVEAIGGILCRCTGYRQIIEAILDVSQNYPKK